MKAAEFSEIVGLLGKYSSAKAGAESPADKIFVQAVRSTLKLVAGNKVATIIADLGEVEGEGQFCISSRHFLQGAKLVKGKLPITFSVKQARVGHVLSVSSETGKQNFPEAEGNFRDFILPERTVNRAFSVDNLGRMAAMFGAASIGWYPYDSVRWESNRLVSFCSWMAATYYINNNVEGRAAFPLAALTPLKAVKTPAETFIGDNSIQIRFSRFNVVTGRYSPPQEVLVDRYDPADADVSVTYNRKQLIDALKGVAEQDDDQRVWLSAKAEANDGGSNYVGSWDQNNWLSLTTTGKGWSTPKAISAKWALRLLQAMDTKTVTLRWGSNTNDVPGSFIPVFFEAKELGNRWKVVLAPIAQT